MRITAVSVTIFMIIIWEIKKMWKKYRWYGFNAPNNRKTRKL